MMQERNIITVSALNKYVRMLLEHDPHLSDLRIRGEISNFVHHRSGHCYFSLKDETGSVKAVMFRADAQGLTFAPQDGMCVVADCRVSLFERDGSFQIYVQYMFPDGAGSVRLAFEQLKARLAGEGLFEPAHKKPLPAMPRTVGVITSATGAALQDIRNVMSRRFPLTRLLLYPVNVQGAEAAPEIAAAIHHLDSTGLVDVIVVARGGGSVEDLWVFNDERIARAAYNCNTPLISAIGHEIDFSILDFVADTRAPTPSAAAEIAVPDIYALAQELIGTRQLITQLTGEKLEQCRSRLAEIKSGPIWKQMTQPVDYRREQLESIQKQLTETVTRLLQQKRQQFTYCVQLTQSLNPLAVLERGYSVVKKDGRYTSADCLAAGDEITMETARKEITCTVISAVSKS